MHFFIGLGNPGRQYEQTRHNAGRMVVEALARVAGCDTFRSLSRVPAVVCKQNEQVFAYPSVYMNESGTAVRQLLEYFDAYQADYYDDLYIIHDDLDIPLGSFKIQHGTGPQIHNGLLSIYDQLGAKNFWHVRVGVDNREGDRTIPGKSYVLQPFSKAEQEQLQTVQQAVISHLQEQTAD